VALELKKTLSELQEQITEEELLLWVGFFELRSEMEAAELEKARKRR
jgi:hypothetical protein